MFLELHLYESGFVACDFCDLFDDGAEFVALFEVQENFLLAALLGVSSVCVEGVVDDPLYEF